MKEQKIPEFIAQNIDLAQPRLGTTIYSCSDEFFAACERMLQPQPAVFADGKFDDNGKWMDGWETRRRRNGGHDWAIIKLGHAGVIRGVDIDTSHFTGNFPPAASLQACHADQIDDETEWTTLVDIMELQGDSQHFIAVDNDRVWTHLRLNIFPDGGIARLRVYGQIHCDWQNKESSAVYELSSMENGGRAIAWNDAHFGQASNLIAPGKGINMGDGWETRRRREPGNDWCILELGHRGVIEEILVDTAYFKGNYPDCCSLQAADMGAATTQSLITQSMFWQELLPEQKLEMDQEFRYREEVNNIGPVTHVRLNIIPDGGISRLRLFGKLA
jgi:allantoicase